MKRRVIPCFVILILGLLTGCGYFQKKDEPPPLPPIEEPKAPLDLKSGYFRDFPWSELPKPRKDGDNLDATLYTVKDGDTIDSIAEKEMGSQAQANSLADYNGLSASPSLVPGDKLVIPNPIIGISRHIRIKGKKEKDYRPPENLGGVEFKQGDKYKLVFEPNADGYLYVFREGAKEGVAMLMPAMTSKKKTAAAVRGRKPRNVKPKPIAAEPPVVESNKVTAFEQVELPKGVKDGYAYESKKAGDRVWVFFSLRPVPALDDLKTRNVKEPIRVDDLEAVWRDVKEGDTKTDPPLIRISDPSQILGFRFSIDG